MNGYSDWLLLSRNTLTSKNRDNCFLPYEEAAQMSKVTIGPRTLLYPMPTVLVGANVGGKPNFMAAAWCGIVNSSPAMISVSLQHQRYTLKGIEENKTFSINVPSIDLVKETDYCGMTSGAKTDKVADCRFKIFYGKIGTAPLIEQCPVNLECRVAQMLDLGSHICIIGQITEVHVTDSCLTNGEPDADKIRPFLRAAGAGNHYREFGKPIGEGFTTGKAIQP
jgi:flavin reductase (DIM6/NTAB) family NADH-FMN oxidoreductase RutF